MNNGVMSCNICYVKLKTYEQSNRQPSVQILAKAAITLDTLLDPQQYRRVPLIQP